jgi:hypothetical protein
MIGDDVMAEGSTRESHPVPRIAQKEQMGSVHRKDRDSATSPSYFGGGLTAPASCAVSSGPMLRGLAAVAVLSLLPVLACKSAASDASGPEGGSVSANPVPHRITRDLCTSWATHGVEATLGDWKASASACPADVQKQLAERLDGQRVSIDQGALTLCLSHLGQAYVPGDASCYMAATTARALAACKFSPLVNPDDTDVAAEIDRMRANCASGRPMGTPAPSSRSTPM